jgi:succinate dehydrogenase / fumarate reductase membrane anchor subunit
MKTNAPKINSLLNCLRLTKPATRHWVIQRLTALALIPFGVWFITSTVYLTGTQYDNVKHWFTIPLNFTTLLSLMGITLYHAYLGLKVIYEDYFINPTFKRSVLFLTQIIFLTAGSLTLWALLSILFLSD